MKIHWWRLAIGVPIAAIAIAWIVARIDFGEVRAVLGPLPWRYIGGAVVIMATDFALRITRWWVLVNAIERGTSWSSCAVAFLTATAANNLLPLRAGDVIRVTAFPGMGVGPVRLAGALVTERLLDVWSLLGIAVLASHVLLREHLPSGALLAAWLTWLLVGFLIVWLAAYDLAPLKQRTQRSPHRVVTVASKVLSDAHSAMHRVGSGRNLYLLMVLSLGAWVLEGGALAVLVAAVLPSAPLGMGWATMGIATLSTMVPAAPGFVGTFHAAAMQPLIWSGVSVSLAAAFAILAHAVVWLPATAAGAVAGLSAIMSGALSLSPAKGSRAESRSS